MAEVVKSQSNPGAGTLALTAAENDARLAAAVTQYGRGTRSYSRSAEKRESDRQRAEVTKKWEAAPRQEVEVIRCHCRSFDQSHDLKRHRELKSESDWRLESERRIFYKEENIR